MVEWLNRALQCDSAQRCAIYHFYAFLCMMVRDHFFKIECFIVKIMNFCYKFKMFLGKGLKCTKKCETHILKTLKFMHFR